jgi:sulfate permease, SulP family
VLGVESLPDGLAASLLAGVSPLSGLHVYLCGTVGGALFAGSVFMAVQATNAIAIIRGVSHLAVGAATVHRAA